MGPVRGYRVWRLHGADREGAVSRVFGERMRAGAVLVGAGEVRRDVGIDCFRVGCEMLLDSGRLGGRVEGCGLGEREAAFVLVVEGLGRCGIGCGCRGREDGCCAAVETGAWRRRGGRGRTAAWWEMLVLWRFGGERMGRNMFGVAGRMVGKDGVVNVRAGYVRGGGGAGDCGGRR